MPPVVCDRGQVYSGQARPDIPVPACVTALADGGIVRHRRIVFSAGHTVITNIEVNSPDELRYVPSRRSAAWAAL
jgi:hypothetical protein